MRIQEMPLHCIKCKHEWLGEMILDAPVEITVGAFKIVKCPSCGASAQSIAFGRGDVPDPVPVQSAEMTDVERRTAWLKLHDSGLSSCCIADKMCGMVPTGHYPHDGDDFGRCERLLILYPCWRARLGEMSSVNGHWAALVARWDEVAEAWRHDVELSRTKGRNAKRDEWKCYDLMRSILDGAAAA
jgi:hypothetical protein